MEREDMAVDMHTHSGLSLNDIVNKASSQGSLWMMYVGTSAGRQVSSTAREVDGGYKVVS